MISDGNALLGSIRIMPDSEYKKVVYEFNDTYSDYPRDKCVHELFAEQAKKNPDKTALIFEDTEFTYRQLDEMSNALAHHLRERGVKPNDIVPIISKRSWHVIVAMLGVLKAGGAFTLLSPDYPSERIHYLISESSAKIVLIFGTAEKYCSTSLDLSKFDFSQETYEIDVNTSYDNFCCAIHTSGSTGNPKLTVLSHRNICNFAYNNVLMKKCDYYISLSTIVFDAFILDTIIPMMNSVPIIIASESETNNQQDFENLITKYKKCGCFATPTKMKSYFKNLINTSSLNNLHTLIIGGEVYDKDLFSTVKKYTNAQSINIYGPTEATINVSQKELEIESDEEITIGKPISNTQIYVLNPQGKVCPIGVPGKLCISGDGVGKGYLNRPELTVEKFVPNPFIAGKTMYKSGDLARWRADGELEYLGRIDTQVKIRGLRIELGEIESVMAAFEGINMTAAADKKDASGRQYLVGYYTSDVEIDEKLLREFLSSKPPRYMIPNYFMRLDEIPMTSSGKTDRKNLPQPEINISEKEIVMPKTAVEMTLVQIWKDILRLDSVSCDDDFFEVGGDSLAAISMLAEIESKLGIHAEMKNILEHTVLSSLAKCLEELTSEALHIPKKNLKKYKLTPQQEAIYVACSKEPESLVYNMPMFIPLAENTDISALKERISMVYNLHPSLRTAIRFEEGEIYGIIDDAAELKFEEYDSMNEFVRPFDLGIAPLMRVAFINGGLAIDVHHIISDGDSMEIILGQIFGNDLQEELIGYADYADDFANRLESGKMSEHIEYFKKAIDSTAQPPRTSRNPVVVFRRKNGCEYY